MTLSGETGDLSLAELIEFFGNLRKTGRLKVEFPEGPGVFYFREGDLVDAQLGQRSGPEAVYHALSMPNASFDFNTHIYASRQTINESWMRLVLEGLRRIDEGIPPEQILADDHGSGDETRTAGEQSIAEVVAQMDDLDRLEDGTWAITSLTERSSPENKANLSAAPPIFATATTVAATTPGNRKKFALFAGIAAFLVCGTAVGALTNWFGKGAANTHPPTAVGQSPAPVVSEAKQAPAPEEGNINLENTAAGNTPSEQQAALAAERRAAERRAAAAAAVAARAALTPVPRAERPAAAAATGSKTVMVQVTVDENGRVSQASVSNSRPGMESYEASALRIARQRRYPAGKSGVISVPVKIN